MAVITADRRDFRKGYNRHRSTYQKLGEKDKYNRRLILFYCVECGLKYLIMNKWNIHAISDVSNDTEKITVLTSHNLANLLKALGYQSMIKLPTLRTRHNELVTATEYHQIWRYGIVVDSPDILKENEIEKQLDIVAQWINEGM